VTRPSADRLYPAIRPAHSQDWDTLIALFRASVHTLARGHYTRQQLLAWAPATIDRPAWIARHSTKSTFIAERGGNVVGFTDLEPDGHIDMLYVHPTASRRGVGLALLAHVEHIARSRGLHHLCAEASITARPCFERAGFTLIARQLVPVRGIKLINYRMRKQLPFRVGAREPPDLIRGRGECITLGSTHERRG
jgi:putative acetyltransferase